MRKQLLEVVEIVLVFWLRPWWLFAPLVPIAMLLICFGYHLVGYWLGVVFLAWGMIGVSLWFLAVLLGHRESGF